MTDTCICNEHSERHGQYFKPVKLCPVHGDPDLLTIMDKIGELRRQIAMIMQVDQARARSRPVKLGKSIVRRNHG